MTNNIERVTLTIETANGEMHKLVAERPGRQGSNPRFMAQQLDAAVTELARRADDTIRGAYGPQVDGS